MARLSHAGVRVQKISDLWTKYGNVPVVEFRNDAIIPSKYYVLLVKTIIVFGFHVRVRFAIFEFT